MRIVFAALALLTFAAHAQAPDTAAARVPTTLIVKFKVKAGQNAAFERAFRDMQASMREHEPGNIYYDLFLSEDPHTYVLIERYRDAESIAAHGKTPHASKLLADLRDVLDGRPEAQRLVHISSK